MTTELISCIAVGGAGILMMLFSLFSSCGKNESRKPAPSKRLELSSNIDTAAEQMENPLHPL